MTSKYISYLMRMWKSEDPLKKGCFASLENPRTKKIIYFRSVEDMFAFLRDDFIMDDSVRIQNEDV